MLYKKIYFSVDIHIKVTAASQEIWYIFCKCFSNVEIESYFARSYLNLKKTGWISRLADKRM